MADGSPLAERDRLVVELRAAWVEALRQPVDRDTDFFDAGGDSLAALGIIATVNGIFERRIPLRTLFDNPQFGAFVEAVRGQLGYVR
jgi:yersiniabactin nonribosomal peptide/polyketide synthase